MQDRVVTKTGEVYAIMCISIYRDKGTQRGSK